jgi:hypothetical protein
MSSPGSQGVVCLGNDVVLEWLRAFCESLSRHNPALPLTLIPFDDRIEQTARLLDRYGYTVLEHPRPSEIDAIFTSYYRGDSFKAHYMRKFCAWDTYDSFLFADADVIFLRDVMPYFTAFAGSDADFVHFATDIERVYRPGELRERMLARHHSAGFNSGVFMSRRGVVTPERVREVAETAAADRPQFADDLDQGLMNYCIDTGNIRVANANDLVQDIVVAGALMRIVESGGTLALDDRRVPQSGRAVSILHWAGYKPDPFMPYRRLFLSYRLPGANVLQRTLFNGRAAARMLRKATPARLYRRLRWAPYRLRSWFSARGLAKWP